MNLQRAMMPPSADRLRQRRPAWLAGSGRLRARLYFFLGLLDSTCILGSFVIAALIGRAGDSNHGLLVGGLLLPVYFGFALNAHAFSIDVIQEPWRGVARAARSLALAATTIILIAYSLKASTDLSRVLVALGFVLSFLSTSVVRSIFLRRARQLVGGNPFTVVAIVDGDQSLPFHPDAIIVSAASLGDPGVHSPAMYDRLAMAVRGADRVVVSCPADRRATWTHALKGLNVRSEIITAELLTLAPLGMGDFGDVPTVVVADGPLNRIDEAVKRSFDIAVSSAMLLLLTPAFVLTAVLIRLETRGPIFFVQTRIGRGNMLFRMFKFRSMRAERSDGAGNASTARDDDRITRVGRFIRMTSIDELPQLLNVLLGNMSIVGPRPHALGSRAEDKLFWEIDSRYWHRHAAKPGLTGLAQIRGHRGATLVTRDLTDRLQADLEYLSHWTIWKDIKIIFMTFKVLIHKNAY